MSKVGVTGGAGFIGTNLVRKLLETGHQVVVIDDLSSGLESNLRNLDIDFHLTSITNFEKLREGLIDTEFIFHLAARGSVPRSIKDPRATFDVNVKGTQNILEVARENRAKVIFSSSSSVYGANSELPKHEKMWVSPISPYAASKLAGEGLVQSYKASYGLEATVLRLFNVFGPFQRPDHEYAAVIPKWIWKAMNNESIEIYGDGNQTRDFTHVDTVVSILLESMNLTIDSQTPVNLAHGRQISLNELVEELRKFFPNLVIQYLPIREGDVSASRNDPRFLNTLFSTSESELFENELRSTIDWLNRCIKNFRITSQKH